MLVAVVVDLENMVDCKMLLLFPADGSSRVSPLNSFFASHANPASAKTRIAPMPSPSTAELTRGAGGSDGPTDAVSLEKSLVLDGEESLSSSGSRRRL